MLYKLHRIDSSFIYFLYFIDPQYLDAPSCHTLPTTSPRSPNPLLH